MTEKKVLEFLAKSQTIAFLAIVHAGIVYLIANFILALILELVRVLKLVIESDLFAFEEFKLPLGSFFEFQSDFYYFYIVFYLIASFGYVKFAYRLRKNFGSINQDQFGSRKWTTLRELKKQYRSVPEKTKEFSGGGGVPISRYKNRIFIDDSPVNNLVIGTTRSGKGETFVFPTIDIYSRAEKKASLIVNDPKGELAASSFETLKKRGYEVYILNLLNPDLSMSYNPLQLVIDAYKAGDVSRAQLLCNTISFSLYSDPSAKDKFWQESAMSLFNAVALAITADSIKRGKEEQINLYSVANFIADLGAKEDEEGQNELDKFFQRRSSTDPARMQYANSNFAKGNTRGSIFSATMAKLQVFALTENAKMTCMNNLDMEKVGFGEKPVAIFMVTPDYDKSNHALASVFVRQLYFVLARKASVSKGNKCEREVVFLLDEFGNMPPIEGMDTIITVCLGRNIRFNLIVQAYSQLDQVYGSASKTISGNCGNQIYILTNDLSTAEHFSKLIGKKTIDDLTRNGAFLSLNKTATETVKDKWLLDPNQLMELLEEESVVVRVIKRQDKKRNKVTPKPIYNTGKTSLKSRWRYLTDEFDTSGSILDLPIVGEHKDLDVERLVFGTKNHKDKFGKITNELDLGDQKLIKDVMYECLPEDELKIFEDNFDDFTFLQFQSFLFHVAKHLPSNAIDRVKQTIKPFFELEEWSYWEEKYKKLNIINVVNTEQEKEAVDTFKKLQKGGGLLFDQVNDTEDEDWEDEDD
ncbi:hypothetical protein E2L07_18245 [Halalkalibacterium halodurans]|uniref:VirD4-like conjugal transfer protein, CD1115 family n=1 Tax=Halalkalibacterium halodurans TaxID=86665 RepID=UPI001067B25D|nr:type IV secretory system conjugative DNA transfer family protein [Halalkalibacterium halodurans]TES48808.1 hypothetical protein E2L07_18245 [Halalkalibacterium halodurans]